MFSSIGWPEIIVIVLLGIVIIGPERMPEVIKDVRAAIYAARKAINNAKAELNGEMGSISAEFDDIRGPLNQAAQWTRLGPKGAITKALFDGDDAAWDDFNPKKMAEDIKSGTAPKEPEQRAQDNNGPARPTFNYAEVYGETTQQPAQQPPQQQQKPQRGGEDSTGGGSEWSDVT
ncbi:MULTISPECIES: twin-arginine translocase TatA/TatE family subunit [Corynebacterium]|uniref:Sec-independent protein translocase protein TatB n=1 Tax=Corynebacterium segmentosum TaxID=43990 RepID=A0ABY6TE47_9CORY|nr:MULTISPECIES: twin-arginine translocase TatA/TatE family subunit [Corynebacterium]EEI15617.1 putative twin arginine-targeting protein translocase TatB [Corynebacterium accolens ATCC 49725]ERS42466.1 twin arginine-targeting protein translocase TatB [Corynebacterium sp. KPL1996]ERS45798.1 twin arginine-targeting protein translocase TatB [Corynebacterium sp. KPL1986]ERS70191.1 twin arginine-targeting protein translocase TatB [Corynebacterium sp. KPL2004]ERS70639.1 twin arginine-targeting prote